MYIYLSYPAGQCLQVRPDPSERGAPGARGADGGSTRSVKVDVQ